MKTRIWSDEALEKREEGCRVTGESLVELAHVTGRAHDRPRTQGSKTVYVEADSVVPLAPRIHSAYDAHSFDLLPFLSLSEQIRAVEDLGGIESARRRLAPSAYVESLAS